MTLSHYNVSGVGDCCYVILSYYFSFGLFEIDKPLKLKYL